MDLFSLVTNTGTAELILNLVFQITAVSLIGWAVMKLWRPRSAPARSAGYLAVLISLALLPFITVMFNITRIAWFQSTIELHPPYTQQYEETFYNGMQNLEGMSSNDNSQSEIPENTFRENHTSFINGDWIIPAINVFGGIWVAGFIVFILRLGFKLSFLKGYMHNLENDDSERLKKIYSTIKHVFKDRPMPEIYFSSSLSSPVTVGILRPVMILPVEVRNIADDEIKSILLHELAHIFHGDNFTGFLQHILSSIFWWNPIVYLLNSSYSDSREDICDNYAINELKSPKKYAATLLNLAEKTCLFSNMPAAAGMSLSKQSLENRVVELLKKERDLSTIYKPSVILLSLTILILISYFGFGMRICFVDRNDSGTVENSKEIRKEGINYTMDPSPGEEWIRRGKVPFNDMYFILPAKGSVIIVGHIPIPEAQFELSPENMCLSWIAMMENKYHWESLQVKSSGNTTVDGYETYYTVFEYNSGSGINKEKVYFIQGDSSFYRIRYGSLKNTFNENLQTFEKYVRSFKNSPNQLPMANIDPARNMNHLPVEKRKTIPVLPSEILSQYTGTYKLNSDTNIIIRLMNLRLISQLTGQGAVALLNESKMKFVNSKSNTEVEFFKDDSGNVIHLILRQDGVERKAIRISDKVTDRYTVTLTADTMSRYAGVYKMGPRDLTITMENNYLFGQFTGLMKKALFPESETLFFDNIIDTRLEFIKDESGKVSHLLFIQGNSVIKVPRIKEAEVTIPDNYGLSDKTAIKTGGGPKGERSYLDMLCGPNGEKIKYKRLGSCCAFESPNAPLNNTGLLDIYEVTYEGSGEPVKVYLNMYDPPIGEFHAPDGFKMKNKI